MDPLLSKTLRDLTSDRRRILPESVREELARRDEAEEEDLKTAASRGPKEGEKGGRQSGALEWRAARGEISLQEATSKVEADGLETRIRKGSSLFTITDARQAGGEQLLTFVGSATHDELPKPVISSHAVPSLQLTPAAPDQLGAVYVSKKINLKRSFVVEFGFVITTVNGRPPHGGGDGFAFVIQALEDMALGLAESGGSGLGYEGIEKCLAVEFDCYESGNMGDPNDNHISVQTRGEEPNSAHHRHSLGATSKIPHLANGKIYFCRIAVDATQRSIRVFLTDAHDVNDGSLKGLHYERVLEVKNVDVAQRIGVDEAWIGFTAATGGFFQCHRVFGVKVWDVHEEDAGVVGTCV
ncbi:peptide-N4-(N-acetyl-beta- glucosaminyl)asparagine amidase [Rhizophlyctis rosea]|nr:peptide-N4-(N-acetyl-beta- glucosaminyl)asparagine amidase [Rhizophlyctis rosea]